MPETNRIAKYLKPSPKFSRSVHLERDFDDTTALNQYVVTEKVTQLCQRFSSAFRKGSTERAWRITGDYGTGKSCFALALARLCSQKKSTLPRQLKTLAKPLSHADAIPVLVTGAREPISAAIIRAIKLSVSDLKSRRKLQLLSKVDRVLKDASPADRDRFALELLEAATAHVETTKQGTGILLVLDELGKSLEFATQRPDEQDITFLQTLAELASRSGDNPIVVLGILHQSFSAYADRMEANDQREWDKIGGRFEELVFDQPLEQLLPLVSNALGVKVERLPKSVVRAAKANMAKAIDLGWFGAVSNKAALLDQAASIYPLQPMLLPVLVKFFSRFGQNERSLFSFLYSADTNALRAFAGQHDAGAAFFGIHQLYDFVRASVGHRLHTRSLSSRWSQIESVIEASLSGSDMEVAILKTVGVLNMLDDQTLLPSGDAIAAAVGNTCLPKKPSAESATTTLRSKRKVLYKRGASYCLWPYTSVNLELKYAEAERKIRKVDDVVDAVGANLEERPIVARRHYVETGNLRHFDLNYVPAKGFKQAVQKWEASNADGVVFVPLCTSNGERKSVIQAIASLRLRNRQEVLIAVPEPINGFAGLVAEIRRWEWVQTNVEELAGDKHAREEVSRQAEAARAVLRDRTNQLLDVRLFREGHGMKWFHRGKPVAFDSSRELFSFVSRICDQVFTESPLLRNELLNRRKLSSAAAAARMRLIERVMENATEKLVGMDPTKKPPEMSMYLSALQATNLHVAGRTGAKIQLPSPSKDACNLLPLFNRIRELLTAKEGQRVRVSDLFVELRARPIGARDGILPLMLAVFCVAEAQHVAIYEDDVFLHQIGGAEFHRLSKVPESFELQYCKLSGVRSEVFDQLLSVVDSDVDESRAPDLIDVVKPLCEFAAGLPEFSRNTTSLSKKSLAVRSELLNATEPSTLLFEQLPKACNLPRIPVRKKSAAADVKKYVRELKKSLGELRSAYPTLLARIEKTIAASFELSDNHDKLRQELERKSNDLGLHVTEPTLKAFCLRLADSKLPRDAWLESVGSLVLAKPPRRWQDSDVPRFSEALEGLVSRFQKTASLAFVRGAAKRGAVRLSLLQANGSEHTCVVETHHDKKSASLKKKMERLFEESPAMAISVATEILLCHLPDASSD